MDYQMAKEILKESGYKLTEQRRAVFECLEKSPEKHLTSEQIHQMLRERGVNIGIATVYRTLLLFDELGIVQTLDIDDSGTRYELVDGLDSHHHHHLICTECGKVEEVMTDLLIEVEENIGKNHDFVIDNHDLIFYGRCKDCRNIE